MGMTFPIHILHDQFIYVTWREYPRPIHLRDATNSSTWRDVSIYIFDTTDSYVTWLMQMWHDSYVIWPMNMGVDPFICDTSSSDVTWLIRMCDVTHSCVTWLIHICDMIHLHITWLMYICAWIRNNMSHMCGSCHTWRSRAINTGVTYTHIQERWNLISRTQNIMSHVYE